MINVVPSPRELGFTAHEALGMAEGLSSAAGEQLLIGAEIMHMDYDDFLALLAEEAMFDTKG